MNITITTAIANLIHTYWQFILLVLYILFGSKVKSFYARLQSMNDVVSENMKLKEEIARLKGGQP